jgi:hypothetical protein
MISSAREWSHGLETLIEVQRLAEMWGVQFPERAGTFSRGGDVSQDLNSQGRYGSVLKWI